MIRLNKYLFLLLLSCLFLTVPQLSAQNSDNPFELKHRLKSEPTRTEEAPPSSSTGNPFDLSHPQPQRPVETATEQPTAVKEEIVSDDQNPFELQHRIKASPAQPENTNPFDIKENQAEIAAAPASPPASTADPQPAAHLSQSSHTFWIIIGMLILYTLSFSMYKSYIVKASRAFSNENFLKLIHREQAGALQFPYLMLCLIFVINAGVFSYFIARHFGYIAQDRMSTLFALIGSIGLLFVLKHLVLRFMGIIFPVEKEIRQYSFTIVIFSIIVGLVLAPLNTFIAYAPESITTQLIFISAFMIAFIYLFRYFRGLFIGSRYIAMHKFHFFMYLCTVEIAPVFILLKIIMLYAGIQ